jgi:hypothetical protein
MDVLGWIMPHQAILRGPFHQTEKRGQPPVDGIGLAAIHHQQGLPILAHIGRRHSLQSEDLAVGPFEPAAELLQIVKVVNNGYFE